MAESSGNRTYSDLPPGSTLGRYAIVERIGGGGMADIYLAKQNGPRGFERVVALKVMKDTEAESNDFTDMFLDEARIAAQLSHPNIVQIYDFGQATGRLFIAMEYLAGPTLGAVLRRPDAARDPLPFHLGAQAVAAAAGALDFAHKRKDSAGRPLNIVHRDVSPDNLVVTFDGTVKVLDFGIAKAERRYAQTAAGLVKGKLGYMAPEQLRGLELDGRADVYSLGVVLFEALSGAHPFDRRQEAAVAYVTRGGPPPRARARNFAVPEALDELTAAAMARDADARLRSAAELQRLLELWIREKVPAGAESWEHWLGLRFGAQRDERAERLHTLTGDGLQISVEEPEGEDRTVRGKPARSTPVPPAPPPPPRPSTSPTTPGSPFKAKLPPKPPEQSSPSITFTNPRNTEQSDPSITSPVGRPKSDPAKPLLTAKGPPPPPVQSDPVITVAASPPPVHSDPVITVAASPASKPVVLPDLETVPPTAPPAAGDDGDDGDTDVSKPNRLPRPQKTPARPQPAPLQRKPAVIDDDDDNIPTQAWAPNIPKELLFGYGKSQPGEDKNEPTGARPLSPEMLGAIKKVRSERPDTVPQAPAAKPSSRPTFEEENDDHEPQKNGWPAWLILLCIAGVGTLVAAMIYALRSTLPVPMIMQQQKTGRVAIHSSPPGASVSVDDVARGKAPLELELSLGTHHLVAHFDDAGEASSEVELVAGGEERNVELEPPVPEVVDAGPPDAGAPDAGRPDAGALEDAKADPHAGTLNLDTTPWTNVAEGKTQLGKTPLSGVQLAAGTHKLRLVNPDKHLDRTLKVTIKAGQVTTQRVKLK
ncbi:MAG: protein kinase [Deltaproteobacteria bacterium]|nr:protein kinase [Deltaproteobacteria bacterium]